MWSAHSRRVDWFTDEEEGTWLECMWERASVTRMCCGGTFRWTSSSTWCRRTAYFFAPLAWYDKTDPFEGFMPRVAMEALASIPQRFRDEQRETLARLAEQLPPAAGPQLQALLADVEAHVPSMKALYKNIVSCLMVNCWYQSPHESEAMWGLYSRQGGAFARAWAGCGMRW